jgi:hypothetical protein
MWFFQREGIVVLPYTSSSSKEEFKIKQEVGNKIENITQKNKKNKILELFVSVMC